MANRKGSSSNSEFFDDLEMQDVGVKEEQSHGLLAENKRRRSSKDDLEMLHSLDLEEERKRQTESLLTSYRGGDDNGTTSDEQVFKVEWHIRTLWAILGSIAAAGIVFAAMVLFARFIIVQERVKVEQPSMEHHEGFRRPASDYVLDPGWDFNAPAQERHYKFTIGDIVANPDGVFRPMIVINGQFPGPMIECNEGDTLVVEVDNQSINATTIHFHGLYQNGTNWMDGTIGITQCPIAPQQNFIYRFKVSGQSGTYYYHGHMAVQAADGLVGPLVIHSRDERKLDTLKYSSDRVVMVQDYYHDLSSGLLYETLMPGNEGSPIPHGALINGRNIRDCSTITGRTCNNATASLPSINLAADQSHKLRFINVGTLAWFQVELDEHEFAITEVDGTQIIPYHTTRLMIGTGQRHSVVIKAPSKTSQSFWLRARMVTHCFTKNWRFPTAPANEVRAIVIYTSSKQLGALTPPPTSTPWKQPIEVQCRDMSMKNLIPAEPILPPSPDVTYHLRANIEIGNWRLERGFFNTSSFRPNLSSPSLHRTLDGLHTSNLASFNSTSSGINNLAFTPSTELVIQAPSIKTIDLIIQNFDEGNHPLHLHGHKFFVLGQGHAYFPPHLLDETDDDDDDKKYSTNPLRRDVATVEGFGWLWIRFVADNPGLWAFHCHMGWHSEAGLVMQFLSRMDVMMGWRVPAGNEALCAVGVEELGRGGDAGG